MAIFQCLVAGENFPGLGASENGLVGFFTTRHVEADNEQEAEQKCMELLRQDPDLIAMKSRIDPDQPPAKVYFEYIDEVAEVDGPDAGFTFFPMD